jgi:hypothetical protein
MPVTPELPLVRQLSSNSDPYRDPLARVRWADLSLSQYWLPPEATSLYGLPEYEQLDERTRRQLSQYEFLGVIRSGLWFEALFMQRLTARFSRELPLARHAYLLHEVREEAGHSLMFLKLMETSGLSLPDLHRARPRRLEQAGRWLSVDGALFWIAVLIGEDLPDKLNRYIRQRPEGSINEAIRDVCLMHMIDEARHVAYARKTVETQLATAGALRRRVLPPLVRRLFAAFVDAVFLPTPDLYELAGLAHGARWRSLARRSPHRQAFLARLLAPSTRLMEGYGFRVSVR